MKWGTSSAGGVGGCLANGRTMTHVIADVGSGAFCLGGGVLIIAQEPWFHEMRSERMWPYLQLRPQKMTMPWHAAKVPLCFAPPPLRRHSTLQPPSIPYQSEPQRSDIKDNLPFPRGSVARRDEDEQGSAMVAISQSSHSSRISEMASPRHIFLIQNNLILTGFHAPKITFSHMAGIPYMHRRIFVAAG